MRRSRMNWNNLMQRGAKWANQSLTGKQIDIQQQGSKQTTSKQASAVETNNNEFYIDANELKLGSAEAACLRSALFLLIDDL